MFGKIGELASMMKQVNQLQSKMKEMQEAAANSRFEADSGAGAVTATVNGKMELVDLKIQPDASAAGDLEMLEDLIKSAIAAAQRKAQDGVRMQMSQLTGGLNVPGLDELMGGAK